MSRRSLGFLAIAIILVMGMVATAGLDNLPRRLRNSVETAAAQLSADQNRLAADQAAVERAVSAEPDLFGARAADWRQRMAGSRDRMAEAGTALAALQQLAQENNRTDQKKVEDGLSRLESLRAGAVKDVAAIRAESERWLKFKQELPQQLAKMKANYEAVQSFDIQTAAAPVHAAMTDWPAKRDDLEKRVAGLGELKSEGQRIWDTTAELRAKAEANQTAGLDYPALFQASDRMDQIARELRERPEGIKRLAGQLYESWDKLLLDLDDDDGRRQQVRVVRTRYKDAALSGGATSQEERWEPVDAARFAQLERNVGMVIERKPAGKYESEVERQAQTPAYAYIAPPGQSNAYGSWSGGVWHWLPQYLILSRLLQGPSIGTVTSGDFDAYQRARRRGEIFYGRDGQYRRGWEGRRSYASRGILGRAIDRWRAQGGTRSGGGFYRERERPSFGGRGFSGSRYSNRGTFSGSRFQSRGGFGSRSYSRGFGRSLGRALSRGGRR